MIGVKSFHHVGRAGMQWLVVEPENERENGFSVLAIGHGCLNNLMSN